MVLQPSLVLYGPHVTTVHTVVQLPDLGWTFGELSVVIDLSYGLKKYG